MHFAGSGCQKQDEILSYSAPKDPPPAAPSPSANSATAAPIGWTIPTQWKPLPAGEMRYATFGISSEHPDVVLTVIPLPREQNPLLPNVIRWQKQLGLPESSEADLPKVVTHVELSPNVAAEKVDLKGKDPKTGAPRRMLAAMLPHETVSWFFKLDGPADVVAAEAERFDAFLKSVHFTDTHQGAEAEGSASLADSENRGFPMKVDPSGRSTATHVEWSALPPGWQNIDAAAAFRLHTIRIDANGQQAELAITRMNHLAAGDALSNLNRWRNAIGLASTEDGSMYKPEKTIVCGQEGWMFEVDGPEKKIFVATTVSGQDFWFFKLTGPKDLVTAQRSAFEAFLNAARLAGDDH